MRVMLAQINVQAGNFVRNTEKIINAIHEAKAAQADLVVFPELAVCGYPPRDFLNYPDFIRRCREQIDNLLPLTDQIAVLIGCPSINPNPPGKDLYNSAWFLADGEVKQLIHKTLLPNYDVFDEYRYFEPNDHFFCIEWRNKKIAVTICEDIWDIEESNPLYIKSPLRELIKQSPDFMVNLSASPFSAGQLEKRRRVLYHNASIFSLPIVYVNQVGAQTELIFDGGSNVVDARGNVCVQSPFFEESLITVDLDRLIPQEPVVPVKEQRIKEALVLGIHDYFQKLGFKKAIIGLSGGVDSALVLTLACEALGSDNVLAVLLPSRYSSSHSITDAVHLCENLGCQYEQISIEYPFQAILDTLAPQFQGLPQDLTEENIQARVRAVLLMAISNKKGYILLNTSNKSEAAVGYGTLYGDMCGGLSVIGDLYKTEVYALCRLLNRQHEIIPHAILEKAPSAELRPNQKDVDSLPEYDLLDQVLYHYIEECLGPNDIKAKGFPAELVDRILRMVNMNEWKRYQSPPILRISSKAFGMGRRLPIEGRYLF